MVRVVEVLLLAHEERPFAAREAEPLVVGPRGSAAVVGPRGGAAIVGRPYYGGVWYGTGRRYWNGRWWPYGVGTCWRRSPIGFVWVCG